MYVKIVKRSLDIIFAFCLIIITLPLLLLISIAIRFDSKGKVVFRQKRVGINKSHFQILKFRTMTVDTPSECATDSLKNAECCITRVGKFLRKTSLDEIPQLINILKGEMSFIGPRPALWNQFDLIAERDKYGANDILPGLTGWAQINGRDELSIYEKSVFDGIYKENLSFFFDLKCLLLTLVSVIKRDGIVEGQATKKD